MLTGFQILNRVQQLVAGIALAANAWSGIRQVSDYASLSAAVAAIGATPTMLNITEDAAVDAAITIPSTLLINSVNGAKLVWESGGLLTFEGQGLVNPMSASPIFSGFVGKYFHWMGAGESGDKTLTISDPWGFGLQPTFAAGDAGRFLYIPDLDFRTSVVTVTDSTHIEVADDFPSTFSGSTIYLYDLKWETAPPQMSSALVASSSLTEKLRVLTAACSASPTEFHCYPSTITDSVRMSDYHSLYFLPGEFLNTTATKLVTNAVPFYLGSHCRFHSAPGAVIYESSVDSNGYLIATVAGSENTVIENSYFKGTGITGDAISAGVLIVDSLYCHIRDCVFDNLSTYMAGIAGFAEVPSRFCTIDGNVFTGAHTQLAFISHGEMSEVTNNRFYLDGISDGSSFACLDIELNTGTNILKDILVAGNHIYLRNTTDGATAIALSGAQSGTGRITVERNKIVAYGVNESPVSSTVTGIGGEGWENVIVRDNEFQGVVTPIYLTLVRYAQIHNNLIHQANFKGILLNGVIDSDIGGNILNPGPQFTVTSIEEKLYSFAVNVNGTAVTGHQLPLKLDIAYPLLEGARVLINDELYTIDEHTLVADGTPLNVSLTADAGVWVEQNFATTDVDTTGNDITATAHGYQTGARIYITSTTSIPEGIPTSLSVMQSLPVYVIRVDANTIQLADNYDDAIAETPLDLTNQGTGTHTIVPTMTLYSENNTYWGNKAVDGILIEEPSLSVVTAR